MTGEKYEYINREEVDVLSNKALRADAFGVTFIDVGAQTRGYRGLRHLFCSEARRFGADAAIHYKESIWEYRFTMEEDDIDRIRQHRSARGTPLRKVAAE